MADLYTPVNWTSVPPASMGGLVADLFPYLSTKEKEKNGFQDYYHAYPSDEGVYLQMPRHGSTLIPTNSPVYEIHRTVLALSEKYAHASALESQRHELDLLGAQDRTMQQLLAINKGRMCVRTLGDKHYDEHTDEYARRPVVAEAKAYLQARVERRTARGVAVRAQHGWPSRYAVHQADLELQELEERAHEIWKRVHQPICQRYYTSKKKDALPHVNEIRFADTGGCAGKLIRSDYRRGYRHFSRFRLHLSLDWEQSVEARGLTFVENQLCLSAVEGVDRLLGYPIWHLVLAKQTGKSFQLRPAFAKAVFVGQVPIITVGHSVITLEKKLRKFLADPATPPRSGRRKSS